MKEVISNFLFSELEELFIEGLTSFIPSWKVLLLVVSYYPSINFLLVGYFRKDWK